jgi:hypothetical protein
MTSLFLIQSCAAQTTNLPKEMPGEITVYLNESGGMMRAYKRITIDAGVLKFEELKGGGREPQIWTAKVSREDLERLYETFVENRFETIANDERKGIVYDAGSESISISINKLKSFGVTYGKNSPLSGENLARYQRVRKSLGDLIARYKTRAQTPVDAENYIQGTWRVAGENGGRSWFLEWSFDNGGFRQTGYPPIIQEGKYRVASAGDDRITLELYGQQGTFGGSDRVLPIIIDRSANRLTISGTKGFSRTGSVKNE